MVATPLLLFWVSQNSDVPGPDRLQSEVRPGWVGRLERQRCLSFHKTTNTHSDRGGLSVVITGDNYLMIISIISCRFQPFQCQYYFILFREHSCGSSQGVCACVCGGVCVCVLA